MPGEYLKVNTDKGFILRKVVFKDLLPVLMYYFVLHSTEMIVFLCCQCDQTLNMNQNSKIKTMKSNSNRIFFPVTKDEMNQLVQTTPEKLDMPQQPQRSITAAEVWQIQKYRRNFNTRRVQF